MFGVELFATAFFADALLDLTGAAGGAGAVVAGLTGALEGARSAGLPGIIGPAGTAGFAEIEDATGGAALTGAGGAAGVDATGGGAAGAGVTAGGWTVRVSGFTAAGPGSSDFAGEAGAAGLAFDVTIVGDSVAEGLWVAATG